MSNHRSTRVAEAIKQEVAGILLFRLKDARVPSERVTITDVEVTRDLRHATIYVSVLGEEEQQDEALRGLASASGFIRTEVGKAVQLRSTPELHFKLDNSLERGANITALLNRIKQEQSAGETPEH